MDENDINSFSGLVFNFNKGKDKSSQRRKLKELIEKYQERGAELIILGCTELAVMVRDVGQTLDPMDLLIEEIIRKVYSDNI